MIQPGYSDIFQFDTDSHAIRLPFVSHKVAAGFPSPADDYIAKKLSLDEHLIANKDSTFFMYAKGDSMIGAGIFDGDILVVDKAAKPISGKIVIAVLDNEFTVKRLILRDGKTILQPENPAFRETELKEGQELEVWGVVVATARKLS